MFWRSSGECDRAFTGIPDQTSLFSISSKNIQLIPKGEQKYSVWGSLDLLSSLANLLISVLKV